MKVLFSINDYDRDGDVDEEGIFLHFENTRIYIGRDIKEFDEFVEHIKSIQEELTISNMQGY